MMPRPSFGCQVCRSRKIKASLRSENWRRSSAKCKKCDRRQGGCLNCDRYGIPCPGVPSRFDVLHRRHAPPSSTERPSIHEGISRVVSSGPAVGARIQGPPSPGHHLVSEEYTLALYYASYCVEGTSRRSLEDLHQVGNGCLLAAAKLMGLQAMAQKWIIPNADHLLHLYYATAIGLLNSALANEFQCRRDSTLLTTILLSAVETKACSDQSAGAWLAHSQGAATLLSTRGPLQVTNTSGSAMFFQVAHQIFTSCLMAKCPVPKYFTTLSREVGTYVADPAYPLWRYHWVMVRLIDFLASNDEGNLVPEPNELEAAISKAMVIQSDMTELFVAAPQLWQYDTVKCDMFPEVTAEAHIYKSVTAAQMWNGKRIATIKLSHAIKSLLNSQHNLGIHLDGPHMIDVASEPINAAATECLKAAPQVLELAKARMQQTTPPWDLSICHDAQLASYGCFVQVKPADEDLPVLQACLLQWSIYFAAECNEVKPELRRRLVRVLDYVGDAMHVQQWKMLADRLRPLVP